MRGNTKYIYIFVVALLLQVFMFNNLTISVLLAVHIYPLFIISLPINTSQIRMLLFATLLGVALDIFAAGFGLYTITCVASSMCRAPLIKFMLKHREVIDNAVPSPSSLEQSGYLLFVILYMALQMALFIGIESLGIDNVNFVVAKYFISLTISVFFVLLLHRALRREIS